MICAYCGIDKLKDEMTKEHIIPRSIGGNIEPINPFILYNVCPLCNNRAGLYIDGPFVRSWFINNYKALNYLNYVCPEEEPILPLMFLGELDREIITAKSCDLWLGPGGTNIFHFHDPYPEESHVWSVGIPLGKKIAVDPGLVFIIITTTNPIWYTTIFKSIYNLFPGSIRYCANPSVKFTPDTGLVEIPAELLYVKEALLILNKNSVSANISHYLDFQHRFMAKMSLGMGSLFLKDYVSSEDANRLRHFMWTIDPGERSAIQILGYDIFHQIEATYYNLFGWEPGYIILLIPIDRVLMLNVILFGRTSFSCEISRNPNQWKSNIDRDGMLYVVSPVRNRAIGPVDLAEYLNVRLNHDSVSDLAKFLARYGTKPTQPPLNLP